MNNEENTKQAWQTPEIVDLDVTDNTGKPYPASAEAGMGWYGPS
nr:hypothetical protein [uncultured Draconibacterium sp.]